MKYNLNNKRIRGLLIISYATHRQQGDLYFLPVLYLPWKQLEICSPYHLQQIFCQHQK